MVWATTLSVLALVSLPASTAAAGPNTEPAGPDTGLRPRASRFEWPLRPEPMVTHGFDPPATEYGSGHRGADLAAKSDQRVLAAAAGTVVYAGPLAGRGVISIQHRGGIRTTYEPVNAEVSVGDRVGPGQVIGMLATGHTPGHSQCSDRACLHWGVRTPTGYLDPLMLVRDDIVIALKPW